MGPAAVQIFAHVLSDGFVVPSRSFGITKENVSRNGADYCFTDLPPISGAQVTVDFFERPAASDVVAAFGQSETTSGCKSFVKILLNGVPTSAGFFINFTRS